MLLHFLFCGKNFEGKSNSWYTVPMQCPQCFREMQFQGKQFTYRKDGKEYLRELYQCVEEDIWVTIEKPTGEQRKLA